MFAAVFAVVIVLGQVNGLAKLLNIDIKVVPLETFEPFVLADDVPDLFALCVRIYRLDINLTAP